jgi:Holliday junction resolvasome RuvABC DNA-binding subunit
LLAIVCKLALAAFQQGKAFIRNENDALVLKGRPAVREDRQYIGSPKPTNTSKPRAIDNIRLADAISALTNLGYRKSQAVSAISHAASIVGEGADIEILIKLGLKALAK